MAEQKKYKLTKNKKEVFGRTLYQIEAIGSFGGVIKGELGGWIEKEENLSQDGNAWVYGNAQVYGDAWVYGNAHIYGDARVYGNAQVYGDAWVYGKLKLLAGVFFGMRYKKEEIKYHPIDNDYELIYKGEAKFEEESESQVKAKQLREKADELLKQAKELEKSL